MLSRALARNTPATPRRSPAWRPDPWFVAAAMFLLGLGVLMVSSASLAIADRQLGEPFHYLLRQLGFLTAGTVLALAVMRIELQHWQRRGGLLLILGMLLLLLVLVPGVGREVNGSMRWIPLGVFNVQSSELVKLFVVIYLAGYLVRHNDEVRSAASGFLKPMAVLAMLAVLLLAEPDFGSATIMLATACAMLFLGGVKLWQFGALLVFMALALAGLAVSSPYRMQRITAFMDPWADPFASGFQLTQALIAFGRGEWTGVGLGSSIQKLFYLPEAHTDFLFAVVGEELGFLGVLAVLSAFVVLVVRAFIIARRAEKSGQLFAAYLGYGLAVWIGIQALVNIGVNMGVLPTKGLTLPLMSYGGSSLIVMCIVVALLLRIDFEAGCERRQGARRR